MTIIGLTTVRSCPHCSKLIRERSYLSGNSIGARTWTDGYMQGLMLPDIPELVKCPTCKKVFWLKEAEELGYYNPVDIFSCTVNPENTKECIREEDENTEREIELYENSLDTEEPNESDYLVFIKNNRTSPEQERSLRILSWWKSNEKYRGAVNKDSIGRYIHGDTSSDWIFKDPIELEISDKNDFLELVDSLSITGEERERFLEDCASLSNQLSVDDVRELRERYEGIFKVKFSPAQIDNIRALSSLLDESDPNNLIMKAEIARELGDFCEANKLLSGLFTEEYKQRMTHELYDSYLSEKEERKKYGEEVALQTTDEIYESHINEFKGVIEVIKLLCDYKIVCVADICVVLSEMKI